MIFDMHVHLIDDLVETTFGTSLLSASASYFRSKYRKMSFEELEEDLKSQGVDKYALLPLPSKGMDSSRLNAVMSKHVRRSIMAVGFGVFNPAKDTAETIREARKSGLIGLKVHPSMQELHPDDERLYPAYEELSKEHGVVVIHTGTSGIGGGTKGGGGFRIEYSRPIYVDNAAADFPDVNFVLAHFGWPWSTEALAIAMQKSNVYIDLSGWSPKYIPLEVWSYARSGLQDRVLFGSDYPLLQPWMCLKAFKDIVLPENIKSKILFENSNNLFKSQ
jgi:uncharacterized protein